MPRFDHKFDNKNFLIAYKTETKISEVTCSANHALSDNIWSIKQQCKRTDGQLSVPEPSGVALLVGDL